MCNILDMFSIIFYRMALEHLEYNAYVPAGLITNIQVLREKLIACPLPQHGCLL